MDGYTILAQMEHILGAEGLVWEEEDTIYWEGEHVALDLSTSTLALRSFTERGLAMRLDAPLVAVALNLRGRALVRVDLPSSDTHTYRPLSRRVELVDAEPEGRVGILGKTRVLVHSPAHSPDRGVPYVLDGPVGLRDIQILVEDAMKMADPADDADDCESGAHGSGGLGPPPWRSRAHDDLRRAITMDWPICQDCLDKLEGAGFPLSPLNPKEW